MSERKSKSTALNLIRIYLSAHESVWVDELDMVVKHMVAKTNVRCDMYLCNTQAHTQTFTSQTRRYRGHSVQFSDHFNCLLLLLNTFTQDSIHARNVLNIRKS